MKFSLAGGSYSQVHHDISVQRCVNWYTKVSGETEQLKEERILVPTNGTTLWADLGGARVRGLKVHKEYLYAVVDNKLYKIDQSRDKTLVGTLNRTGHNRRVLMETNFNDQLFIADNELAYIYDIQDDTLTLITDPEYVGADSLTYLDNYMVVTRDNYIRYSEVNDANSWVATDLFNPSAFSDSVLAVTSFQESLICFGEYSIEMFIETGNDDAPFERAPRMTTMYGLGAIDSICRFYGGVVFLGRSQYGGYAVYLASLQYDITQISPTSINQELNKGIDLSDSFAYLYYTNEGHAFYTLSLPSIDRTFAYDFLSQEWHERQSLKPFPLVTGQIDQGMLRNNCVEYYRSQVLYGDYYSGAIYIEDKDSCTEAGNAITRLRVSPIVAKEQDTISLESIEIDVNSGAGILSGQGSNPVLMLQTSKDGGQTWDQERLVSIGLRGAYRDRVKVHACGIGRNWVLSVKITDPVPLIINSVVLHGSMGEGI